MSQPNLVFIVVRVVYYKLAMFVLKIIKNTLLIFLLLAIISIPVLMYFIKFNNTSLLGAELKTFVLEKPNIVRLTNLNEPGDARFSYFNKNKGNVNVNLVSVNYKKTNENVNLWIEEMINQTVDKRSSVGRIIHIGYPVTKLLTKEDLNEIRKDAIAKNPADLYLIYASSYAEKETAVGLVLHRDTIFIFRDAIEVLSERENIKNVLEQTTIMHEWGHLLGLGHVNDGSCIMDESVDVYDYPPIGKDLPTRYCDKELQLIKDEIFNNGSNNLH